MKAVDCAAQATKTKSMMAGPRNLPLPPALDPRQALFLDFDGTLVEIAAAPDRVMVARALPWLLSALAVRLAGAVAVISGRPLDELAQLLDPFAGPLVGMHGLERRTADGMLVRAPLPAGLGRARALLADFVAVRPHLLLEDKGSGLALHYRRAPVTASACRNAALRAAALAGDAFELIEGKMVVELRPHEAHKGRAIVALLAEPPFHGRLPVFIGDVRTDEDGFVVVNDMGGLSVQVGRYADTAARYGIPDVDGVLAWLVAALVQDSRTASLREFR